MRAVTVIILGAVLAAAPLAAVQEPLTNVRVVEATWIRDVALMRRESGRPVIYVNPRLLERFGPVMRDFFIAHEYGHVFYGHELGNFGHAHGLQAVDEDSVLMRTRQKQELEADCYAASRLAHSNRPSVNAAVRYFTRMGPFRFDRVHPTGSQRAANLLACVAAADDDEPRPDSLLTPALAAETGAVVIELAPATAERLLGNARVIVDGRSMGSLSTLMSQSTLVVRDLGEGQHRYEIRLELFEHDALMQAVPTGVVIGIGTLDVRRGMRLEVHWLGEEPPALLPRGTAAVAGA